MAMIFDIKHFAVHDGPGIRTTVFLKGCPLKCIWCHNPEGISGVCELAFSADKCMFCRKCEAVCENGVHLFADGQHKLIKENCIYCGKCEKACAASALTIYGRRVDVWDILPELLEDKDFYGEDGGVTLSGGECLIQADFCAELLAELKNRGIHTAVDTSGFVPKESIDRVLPYTDLFLYDIKAYDEEVHIKNTGHSNKLIFENLRYLDSIGKSVEIRIPLIPGRNDAQIEKIAEFLSQFKCITQVKVLPYHKFAESKYRSLGMDVSLPEKIPSKEELEKAKNTFQLFEMNCK